MTTARYVILGALLLAGYYGLIFGYAARSRSEKDDHVAWRYPMLQGNDLCPDALMDGTVVASDHSNIYFVGADGKEKGRWGSSVGLPTWQTGSFAWAGGTRDSLLVLAVGEMPTVKPKLIALESDSKVRWEAEIPEQLEANWIVHSPDSVYVLLTQTDQLQRSITGTLKRYSLDGEELYAVENLKDPSQVGVTKDNVAYITDSGYSNVTAVGPDGKVRWSAKGGGTMALGSRFGGNGSLYLLDDTHLRGYTDTGGKLFALPVASPLNYNQNYPGQGLSLRGLLDGLGFGGGSGYNRLVNYGLLSQACLADGGGKVYWVDYTHLHCVSEQGTELWSKRLPGEPLAIAAHDDGTVYVAMDGDGLAAYGPGGELKWRNASIRNITSAMSIGPTGRVFLEANNELICFEP